ncbi:MAG: polysaccharide biosynthesis/export family protein, partial [Bacteroidota bacterium]
KAPYYRLKTNDIISIKIRTRGTTSPQHLTLEPEGSMFISQESLFLNGFAVSDSGFITMPTLGKIRVAGLTIPQVQQRIQTLLGSNQYKNASVFVTLVSFKVSILGEVNLPGQYPVYDYNLTSLEAIARAGDFKDFANRQQVQLIRRKNNSQEVVLLDFTDANLMESPYYYLQPNDILYVPNLEKKNKRSNLETLTVASIILTAITTGVSIYAIFTP